MSDVSRIEQLFASYRDGNNDALIDLIEVERKSIFDYVLRMTGRREPTYKVLDEVYKAMGNDQFSQEGTLAQLRVRLYATARSFSSHIWNADTSELVNAGYDNFDPDSLPERLSLTDLNCCERNLASLPGWEKEPLLLNIRSGFAAEDVAQIMSTAVKAVEESMNSGFIKITQQCAIDPGLIDTAIGSLPRHPMDVRDTEDPTAALSQIIGDIDKARRRSKWPWIIAGFMVLAVVGVVGYFLRQSQLR